MSTLIPENEYAVKIITAELGEAKTGTPYARLHLEVAEGEHMGRRVSKDLYLSENAWERSVKCLRELGFTGDDITAVSKLAGVRCTAKITVVAQTNKDNTVRTDTNGEVLYKNEVHWVGAGRAAKPMEPAKLTSFAERMRARLQSMPSAAAAPAATTATGDDLPF